MDGNRDQKQAYLILPQYFFDQPSWFDHQPAPRFINAEKLEPVIGALPIEVADLLHQFHAPVFPIRGEICCDAVNGRIVNLMPGSRFETLSHEIGDAFIRVEFPGRKHSTLTMHRQQEAVDRVLAFFREKLLVKG